MAKKRYLFFDIDGTLVAGPAFRGYIPESTALALEKLRKAGHFLSLCTGRSAAMASGYMRELGFENMVSDGGYGITIEGKLLGIRPLPREKLIRLVDECIEKGFPWGIQPDDSDTRLVPDERFMAVTHDSYMKTEIRPGLNPRDYDRLYKMYVACMVDEETQLEALRDLPVFRYRPEYVFIEPGEKGLGIREMMKHLGADPLDAVVFGDGKNDISMFRDPWTKIAMGNAVPELKALADFVTTNAEDDGIYNACEALGLFEPVTQPPTDRCPTKETARTSTTV